MAKDSRKKRGEAYKRKHVRVNKGGLIPDVLLLDLISNPLGISLFCLKVTGERLFQYVWSLEEGFRM